METLFEPIYEAVSDSISRADFWALLGWLSINLSSNGAIPISYQYGRKDAATCHVETPRLPSAQLGRDSIEHVFVGRMGLTMDDAVTLIGAHTLGHVHPDTSGGYANTDTTTVVVTTTEELQTNAWDITPQTFDNEYFRDLIGLVRFELHV